MGIEREQQLCKDYVCFYHSYNYAALLYEVQASIARELYDLDTGFAPLTRLLKGPYNKQPSLSSLMQEFGKMAKQDHDPKFRALAICTSLSLSGEQTEAPPMACFNHGYNGGEPPNYRILMSALLTELGANQETCEHLLDK